MYSLSMYDCVSVCKCVKFSEIKCVSKEWSDDGPVLMKTGSAGSSRKLTTTTTTTKH